jgi:hypothetical protein
VKRLGRARLAPRPEGPEGTLGLGSLSVPTSMAQVTVHRPWLTEVELAAWFGNAAGTWANLRVTQDGPPYFDIPGVGIVYLLRDVMVWAAAYRRTSTTKSIEEQRATTARKEATVVSTH